VHDTIEEDSTPIKKERAGSFDSLYDATPQSSGQSNPQNDDVPFASVPGDTESQLRSAQCARSSTEDTDEENIPPKRIPLKLQRGLETALQMAQRRLDHAKEASQLARATFIETLARRCMRF